MKLIKSLNNNAAVVQDEQREYVVIGTGISFNLKPGDPIITEKIQRKFVAADQAANLTNFDSLSITVTAQFIQQVETVLKIHFSDYQYLSLADHIDLTLKRLKQGIELPDSTMAWAVRRLYQTEYQAAQNAVQQINDDAELAVHLPASEVTSLVLHVVSVENRQPQVQDTVTITKLIADIVHIVQLDCQVSIDAESFNYERFVTHLKAFMLQRFSNSNDTDTEVALDPAILLLMQTKYPQAYQTVQKIGQYLFNEMHWQLSNNEQVYLTLHVWRVTQRSDSTK